MKAEMRNRIREIIIHMERRNAGICIYNKTKICPWEAKNPNPDIQQVRYRYMCQDGDKYMEYYSLAEEVLEKNPHFREILGITLEDTNPDIEAEKTSRMTMDKIMEIARDGG